MTMITVTIPGPTASSSKMAKKGWKCWAKNLSAVATPANDGYAYQGEFVDTGRQLELEIGDVILRVDQSDDAAIGVVMVNRARKGYVSWTIASASADGRKWCGSMAKSARAILAMSVEERIRHVAGLIAADPPADRTPANQAYWDALAAGATIDAAIESSATALVAPPVAPTTATAADPIPVPVAPIDLSTISTADLMAELARREAVAAPTVEPAAPPAPMTTAAAAIATIATVSQLAFAFA